MSETIFPQELKPYLRYSAVAHGIIALGLVIALLRAKPKQSDVYTIDVVGPAQSIVQNSAAPQAEKTPSEPEAAKAPPAHMAESKEMDEFSLRHSRKHEALPAPSLLQGYQDVSAPRPTAKETSQPAATPSASAPSAADAVGMEMADFPFPWYISQVRMALWKEWSARMPGGSSRCVVVFSIIGDGNIVDLRTEESSGDGAFDLTALGAVKDASPFPPLPQGFDKPFLQIHLTLTSQ